MKRWEMISDERRSVGASGGVRVLTALPCGDVSWVYVALQELRPFFFGLYRFSLAITLAMRGNTSATPGAERLS